MTGNTQQVLMWLFDMDKDAVWDIEPHKERKGRSLNANSYFHVLVQKLAQAQQPPVSLAKCKNMMIAAYGQPEYIDGQASNHQKQRTTRKENAGNRVFAHGTCEDKRRKRNRVLFLPNLSRHSHLQQHRNAKADRGSCARVQGCRNRNGNTCGNSKMIDVWGLKMARRYSIIQKGFDTCFLCGHTQQT